MLTTIPFGKYYSLRWSFPGDTVIKNLPANEGDMRDTGSIPRSGRSPRERNGNPLQYSCLEKIPWTGILDRILAGYSTLAAKSQTQKSTHIQNEAQIAKSGLEMKEPSLLGFL